MGGKPQECETGRVGVLQQARGFLLLTGVWLTLGRLELGGWGHSQDLSGPKRPKITSPHLPASRPRAYSPPAAATISLSVERRGFAREPVRGPGEGHEGVRLASPRGSRLEQREVPRLGRLKEHREHGPAGCSAAVTFNPLSAGRPPRDWARRRGAGPWARGSSRWAERA